MRNEHTFYLTKKQADKLVDLVDKVYARSARSPAVPPQFLLLLAGVRSAILNSEPLEQLHIDVCIWAMDLLFAQMEEDEYDPQMEQVYHKLAGWWPVEPPWFERIKSEG